MPNATETGGDEAPPAWGRVDYLKLCVFMPEDALPVQTEDDQPSFWASCVAEGLEDVFRHALEGWDGSWANLGARRRVRMTLQALPGLLVLDFDQDFCHIELTGRFCELVGNQGIWELLQYLERRYEWACRRVDVAWDGLGATPNQVLQAMRSGQCYSRSKIDPEVWENAQGTTVYTRQLCDRGKVEKFARFYNKRGPTRAEFEFKSDAAISLGRAMCNQEESTWADLFMGSFRGFLEFAKGDRANRSTPLPWWDAFCSDAQGLRLAKPTRDPLHYSQLVKSDQVMSKAVRPLQALRRAYGDRWLLDRLDKLEREKGLGDAVELLADELRSFKGSGLCGAPDRDDDIPI